MTIGICLGLSFVHAEEINTRIDSKSVDNNGSAKIENTQKVSEIIKWNATWRDIYKGGAVNVKFLGHKLILKAAFLKGRFDSYTQTYKTIPAVIVMDKKHDNNVSACLPVPIGKEKKITFITDDKITIKVKFHDSDIEITNADNPNQKVVVLYKDVLSKWLKFAKKNKYSILDKTYYFVPQRIWLDGVHHSGFVISTNNPLYPMTGLPQDFVELYKTAKFPTTHEYKPAGFSLAVRFVFVLSDTKKKTWRIREMTVDEIGHEMLNEPQK